MKVTEDMDEAHRIIGEVVLMLAEAGLETTRLRIAQVFRAAELDTPKKWDSGMRTAMSVVIDKLEILPDLDEVEQHG
ncbi:DUF2767 family protein [Vibrio sp.]|uniref:DUF2767 family protein n=1 Tax=Vibrio sp. TaxID=678 RepID=UPI003AA84FC5